MLGKTVVKTESCVGAEAKSKVDAMSNGDVVLLENVRFIAGEENDTEFAKELASLAEVYVNDAELPTALMPQLRELQSS